MLNPWGSQSCDCRHMISEGNLFEVIWRLKFKPWGSYPKNKTTAPTLLSPIANCDPQLSPQQDILLEWPRGQRSGCPVFSTSLGILFLRTDLAHSRRYLSSTVFTGGFLLKLYPNQHSIQTFPSKDSSLSELLWLAVSCQSCLYSMLPFPLFKSSHSLFVSIYLDVCPHACKCTRCVWHPLNPEQGVKSPRT